MTASTAVVPKPRTEVTAKSLQKAIVIRRGGAEITRVIRPVKLSVADDTLVKLPMKNDNDDPIVIPSAKGYMLLAAQCGLFLDHPDTLIVNGVPQPNGYYDEKTKTHYFRSRAAGFTDSGQPFLTDRTVAFPLKLYEKQDLLAKAKWKGNVDFFEFGALQRNADGHLINQPKGKEHWAGLEINESLVLWYDPGAPKLASWMGASTDREISAIRTCQTFADRNAIAAHPGLPAKRKFTTAEVTLNCSTWFASKGAMRWDKSIMEIDVQKLIEAVDEDNIDASAINITDQVEEVSAEEAAESTDAESAAVAQENAEATEEPEAEPEADTDGDGQPNPPEAEEESDAKYDELVAAVKTLKNTKPPSQFKKACAQLDLTIKKDADIAELTMAKLNQLHRLLQA